MDNGPAKKARLNAEWLSDCSGCHMAIVDNHEKILQILDSVVIQHFPVLTDIKGYPHAEIGLVSGAVRTGHDREAAIHMRESCDIVIAWGTCAVYGGIAGAGNVHTKEEILSSVYQTNSTTIPSDPPSQKVSPLEDRVLPIDEVIEVDYYLPGCPPHAAYVFDTLISLLEGRNQKAKKESVCSRCSRIMKKTDVSSIKSISMDIPEKDTCFLSQGFLCMGSVTIDRCFSPCPGNGVVCTGCAGATMQILSEPNRDIRTEIADRMSRLTKIDRDIIIAEIERTSKTHYSYTMSTKMIGQKPTFLIGKWITDAENDYE